MKNDNENANDNSNDIIFIVKDTKVYVLVQKTKILTKGSERSVYWTERSVYWNEYKTKSENRNTANIHRYFLGPNFVGVNRLFVLVYSDKGDDSKIFKTRRYYLP